MSALLKVLGRSGRPRILGHLLRHPANRFTPHQLARECRLAPATAWRSVGDLKALGIAVVRKGGVQLNPQSPTAHALARLELPRPHLLAYRLYRRRIRSRLPGVRVRLFGSVARGEEGPDSDVDVLVIFGGTGWRREAVLRAAIDVALEVDDAHGLSVVPLVTREDDPDL